MVFTKTVTIRLITSPIYTELRGTKNGKRRKSCFSIRAASDFAPRIFGLSPLFTLMKANLNENFEYKKLNWDPRDS